jgi:hypothetical protein
MANVTTKYVRLTSNTASAGGGETRLISPGTAGTNFNGSLSFGAKTLSLGDTIRIFAWGRTRNVNMAAGSARVRLYFNGGSPANLAGSIADTGAVAPPVVIQGNLTNEWNFFAQILIAEIGENGKGWCDSYVQNVENLSNFNKMSGKAAQFTIDTTVANELELSALVANNGAFDLDQCTIELLPSP